MKDKKCKMDFLPVIWQEPWLTPVIFNLQNIIETEKVQTAAVSPDGKTFCYNPYFWESLTEKERLGVQLHELLHIVNLHSKRRRTRLLELWNIACDMAINHQITSAGYRLPAGALPGENDMAENIYKKLFAERVRAKGTHQPNSPLKAQDSAKAGNQTQSDGQTKRGFPVRPQREDRPKSANEFCAGAILTDDLLPKNPDGGDVCADVDTLEAVEAAAQLAGRGSSPLSGRFSPAPPTADWRVVLQNLVRSALGDECDYLSYEFDEFGICEDILSPKLRPKVCALVDESGSIEDTLYQQFLGELEKINHFAEVFASGFTDNSELRAVPLRAYRRTMTGGTDVRRAYEEACRRRFDCIIVLTDGYLAAFPEQEPVDTIWAMPKSFGRKREVIL